MKRCTSAMSTAIAVLTAFRSKASPSANTAGSSRRGGPVVHEGALLSRGRALGVEHHVDPRGGAGDRALVGPGTLWP